jgi:hypothetical protein
VEVPPIVNPYSIVALAAALIGLFPVAIVFGLISFSHPRGRVMALFALLFGIVELMALTGVVMLSGARIPHPHWNAWSSADNVVVTTAAPAVTPAPTPPPITAAPITPSSTAPITVDRGQMCAQTDAALIGAANDGTTVLCLHGTNGYRWTGPYTVSTTVAEGGGKCLAGIDKTARTADGHALVCEGQNGRSTWTLWVE